MFVTNQVCKESTLRKKNTIATIFYIIGLMTYLINSRKTILICEETTNKVFIISGYDKKPEINRWYQLNNSIVLNEQNTFYTSSSNNKIDGTNFKLKTKNGNFYNSNGTGQYNANCEYANSIFTIYFDITNSDSDSIDDARFRKLKERFCRNVN